MSFGYNVSPNTGPVAHELPLELKDVGIEERLGSFVPLNQWVKDEQGHAVTLESLLSGRPVLLSFVYFNCPSLCSLHLNGVFETLQQMSNWMPGQKFDYWVISFDSRESSQLALSKKRKYLEWVGWDKESFVESSIRFLTADEPVIKALTESVGFKFKWNESLGEWMHASALIVLSPEGQIIRYLHGVMFEPDQIKLALMDAAAGKVGSVMEKLIWFCYRYDPQTNKYTLYVWRLIQLSFVAFTLMVLITLGYWHWREREVS